MFQVLDYSVGLNVGGGAGVGAHTGGAHGGGEKITLLKKLTLVCLLYVKSLSGGGHDIWGDLGGFGEEESDFRSIREQETEVILAFTLLITILLTFIGQVLTFSWCHAITLNKEYREGFKKKV